jgi:acetyl esterase/lipase
MKWILPLLAIAMTSSLCAQEHCRLHPNVPADTSYNVRNELIKQSVRYPFITIAQPFESDSVAVYRDLVYETIGERELHLDVFQPRCSSGKETPVVVMIHGGGWRSGEKNMEHYMAGVYAKNGIAAVCLEYRMSMEAKYPAALQDIKTGIRWVRAMAAKYHFDPLRVAIEGESAGGQMASLIGAMNEKYPKYQTTTYKRYSDKVQAAIDVDGVLAFIHPESGEGADKPGKPSAGTLWFGVSSKEDSTLWMEASALTHAGKQSVPFLFLNSAQPRFHAGQHDMMEVLRKNGIYCEEHLLEGTPHSFWLFHPWVDETMKYTVAFLKKVFAD